MSEGVQDCRLHFVAPTSLKGGVPKDLAPPKASQFFSALNLSQMHLRRFRAKKNRHLRVGSLCPEQESNHLFQYTKIGSKTQYSKGFIKVLFLLIYFNYPFFSLFLYLYCTSGTNIDTYFIP
jgi:hypothetical protein